MTAMPHPMQPMERVMVDGWKRQLRDGWNPLYVVQGMQHWVDVRDGGAT